MSISHCQRCGSIIWKNERHTCPPKWEVTEDEQFDTKWHTWTPEYANSAEEAAMRHAERVWDYRTAFTVYVRQPDSAEAQKFEINVEAIPHFHATKEGDPFQVPTPTEEDA